MEPRHRLQIRCDDLLGFDQVSYIGNRAQYVTPRVDFNYTRSGQTVYFAAIFGAEARRKPRDTLACAHSFETLRALPRIDPKVQFIDGSADRFLAGVTGELNKTLVDFDQSTLIKRGDGQCERALIECGGEFFLGRPQDRRRSRCNFRCPPT